MELNLGSAYDEETGKFKAPSGGLYLLFVSIGVHDYWWSVIKLMHNDIVKDIGFHNSGNDNDKNQVTTATQLLLSERDTIGLGEVVEVLI